jgi:lipoic acid synthetase
MPFFLLESTPMHSLKSDIEVDNTVTPSPGRLPEWFRKSSGKIAATRQLSKMLDAEVPNSICQEARCPNRSECFSKGVLTFMILGTTCTRNCGFCSVAFGKPLPPDSNEPDKIVKSIESLNLKFVVLTSPNRDDLPDEGSGHYFNVVTAIKSKFPEVKVEVLVPDFKGKRAPLDIVISANPDVVNHNIETVPSLYRTVRKGSLYKRSLQLLSMVKEISPKKLTKTGVMVGLGETKEELIEVFKDVKAAGVDILTLGQYLKPDKQNLDVVKYYHPDEFAELKTIAEDIGIRYVFSGPSVRSSYLADIVFEDLQDGGRASELAKVLSCG